MWRAQESRHAGSTSTNAQRPPSTPLVLVVSIVVFAVLSLTASLSATTPRRLSAGHLRGVRFFGDDTTVEKRKLAVRDAMQFVWTNYHAHAFGADEITPLDGTPRSAWGNVGCMILDSMDTLWIMDLKDEFEQARRWVHEELSFDNMGVVSVFETIIRSVGGLLSAYDMSGDRVLLEKAVELTERMLPAIDKTTGRANYYLDTLSNASFHPGGLAESGTYQLEFEYLSRATGDEKYATLATKLYPYLRDQQSIQRDGLFANEIYAVDGAVGSSPRTLSLGGGGDSFYEYLLKLWIFMGQPADAITKDMFLDAVDGMEKLLLASSSAGHAFLGQYDLASGALQRRMQHLTCFVPGWLALGARKLEAEDPQRSARHITIARRLMDTCYKELYEKQPSHLSPELVEGPDLDAPRYGAWGAAYVLRPEVVESLYVLHQLTGDAKYQEWGWQIFQAIDHNCRTQFGFAQYKDVTKTIEWSDDPTTRKRQAERVLDNEMQTFFAAETLKYLYLLFDEDNAYVNLQTHVFNTEAHPLSTSLAHAFR